MVIPLDSPYCGVALLVAAAVGVEFELQSVGCLADVYAAVGDIDADIVCGSTEFESEYMLPFLGETVDIGLCGARGGDRTRQSAVCPDLHSGGYHCRIVCDKLEFAFLILPGIDGRIEMPGAGDDASVRVYDLGADEWGAAAALEDVHINALAPEGQSVLLHLGDHLDCVAAHRQTGHIKSEYTVGGAALGDGMEIALLPVDVQRDGLCAGTVERVGYLHSIASVIPTLCDATGDVVAAREREGDDADLYVGLFLLLLAGIRVGGDG